MIIGEKPESLANCRAAGDGQNSIVKGKPGKDAFHIPYWPTDDEPPKMTIGFPAYFPRPPSAQKGVRAAPPEEILGPYNPTKAAPAPTGMVEACSKLMLGGI